MRLSVIVPVLNSHEIVRRQILRWRKIGIPDDTEVIYMDDGSEPPLEFPDHGLKNFRIVPTNDLRPWTWALARNAGARIAKGEYYLMTDLDYIISRPALNASREFTGDRLGFHREFGVLDKHGNFSQDIEVLLSYGLDPKRIPTRGVKLAPHPNNFVIKKSLYWAMGGYREDLIHKPYPQGEDRHFKKQLLQFVKAGKAVMQDWDRPTLYMFPNGQYCGDVDYNPFGLFHGLSRKSGFNPFEART